MNWTMIDWYVVPALAGISLLYGICIIELFRRDGMTIQACVDCIMDLEELEAEGFVRSMLCSKIDAIITQYTIQLKNACVREATERVSDMITIAVHKESY